MRIVDYIRERGLVAAVVSQKLGVTRQALSKYGDPTAKSYLPRTQTLERIAKAMSELGAPTTVVDLVSALYDGEKNSKEV